MTEQAVAINASQAEFFVGMRREDFSRYQGRVAAYADEGRTQSRTLSQISTSVSDGVVKIHRGFGDLEASMGTNTVEYAIAKRRELAADLGIPVGEMQIYRKVTTVTLEDVE